MHFCLIKKKNSFMLLQFIIYCSEDQNFIILHEYKTGEGYVRIYFSVEYY